MSLRLCTNKPNRLKPDMQLQHTQIDTNGANAPAVAGGMGAGPHDQPQLFATPQTAKTSDDYWTPSWVFAAMQIEFDLDVASPPGGSPWVPAKRYYTQEDDGLTSVWEGRVWMNPPYSNSLPWVQKFIAHHNGVCLVQFAKAKYTKLLWATADAIVINDPRFKFEQGPIYMPTMYAAFGDECVEAIKRLGHAR